MELRSLQLLNDQPERECIFEYIYFSRPDSIVYPGVTVGDVRREFGKQLYRENPLKVDIVIDVPDSSYDAARGVSQESGIPYERGLIRSHYIGRTFIESSQNLRYASVSKKFNPNRGVLEGKKIILVDDSLVRGTTMRNLINYLKERGRATEVNVMISSPPYRNSCYLGVDTSDNSLLIARHKSVEEIRDFLGADSLAYLSLDGMLGNPLLKDKGFCTYCFDGIERIRRE